MADRTLTVRLRADTKGFVAGVRKSRDSLGRFSKDVKQSNVAAAAGAKTLGTYSAAQATVGTTATAAAGRVRALQLLLVGLATGAAARVGISLLDAASDAEEARAKFDTVFGQLSSDVAAWADASAAAWGRSRFDLVEYLAAIQDTLVPLGLARQEAAQLSQTITQLAVDLASFNNEAEPEVVAALTSAIVGNHDAVRRYGIVISEAALKQQLLNRGFTGGIQAAGEQEKALARIDLILAGTSDAQGDAARTADSYANQVRRLSANVKELKVALGQELLPIVNEFVTTLNESAPDIGNYLRDVGTGFLGRPLGDLDEQIATLRRGLRELDEDWTSRFAARVSGIVGLGWDEDEIRSTLALLEQLRDLNLGGLQLAPGPDALEPFFAAAERRRADFRRFLDGIAGGGATDLSGVDLGGLQLAPGPDEIAEGTRRAASVARRVRQERDAAQAQADVLEDIRRATLDRLAGLDERFWERQSRREAASYEERDAALVRLSLARQERLTAAEERAVAEVSRLELASAEEREAAIREIRLRYARERLAEAADIEDQRTELELRAAEERARQVTEAMVQAERARQQRLRERVGPIGRGLADYAADAIAANDEIERATQRTFLGMEQAIAQFAATGKFEFADFARSVIADLARIAARVAITGPIANALLSAFAPAFVTGAGAPGAGAVQRLQAGVGHGGLVAGQPGGVSRLVHPEVFARAVRMHQGGIATRLRADEVPTILQEGETVLPRGATIAPPAVKIEVRNEGTAQEYEQRGQPRFDGEAWVIGVVSRDIGERGQSAQALESAYGLRPQVV